MSKISEDFKLNLDILKRCRAQMGWSEEQVKKKVASIASIESGKKRPTYKQLDTLADLYQVPEWVFISDKLPEAYQYDRTPAFRQFKSHDSFNDPEVIPKVRQLIARVEQYRNLLIELREGLDDPVQKFAFPSDLKGMKNTGKKDIEKKSSSNKKLAIHR